MNKGNSFLAMLGDMWGAEPGWDSECSALYL